MQKTVVPNKRFQLKLMLSWLIIFVVGIFPWALMGLIPDIGLTFSLIYLAASAAVLVIAFAVVPFYYNTISYEIGSREITVCKGLITKSEKTVPYNRITNLELKRGPLDRLLGMGTIALHTAGYSQQSSAEAVLGGLEDYRQLHDSLMETVRERRESTGDATAAPSAPAEGEPVLAQILEELRGLREDLKQS